MSRAALIFMHTSPDYQKLKTDTIDIWVSHVNVLQNQIPAFEQTLTDKELERAQRYHFERDKEKFIISRGRLRTLIGQYLGIPANKVYLTSNQYDKPQLDETKHTKSKALYFNVSHSKDIILHAFGIIEHIGVDIEHMKEDRSLDNLAERYYTSNELKRYQNSHNKIETFYKLWSHKEAYIKAIGTGLSTSLKHFEISLSNEPNSIILEHQKFDQNLQWYATDLPLHDRYQAALVSSQKINHLNIIQARAT